MTTRKGSAAVIFVALMALARAPNAAAIDGETLIDQAKALAGNVTPGDTAGFPVTISSSGKYRLTGDLHVPAGKDGIVVTANNVAIDLNDFTISSAPALQALNGILAVNIGALTVKNGMIVEFGGHGISNAPGKWAVVENMRILFNRGSAVALGDDSRLSKSLIHGNTTILGTGSVICGVRCLIEHNIITNSQNGPGVIVKAGGMVLGNVIGSNRSGGVAAEGVVGFGANTLVGNNGGGPQVLGGAATNFPLHPNACSPSEHCP